MIAYELKSIRELVAKKENIQSEFSFFKDFARQETPCNESPSADIDEMLT